MRYPVTFPNRSGVTLVGTLHVPDGDAPIEWPAIAVCLCTAVNPRHVTRILRRDMARGLARFRIPMLTFDFSGVGDSGGELREEWLLEIYRRIEKGCFVNDTLDAIRFMRDRFPSRRTILFGNCGGAITALHAAARDEHITHLVLMGLPVVLSTLPCDERLDADLARFQLGDYLKRLRDPRNWRRIMSRETNYARIWSSLTGFIHSRLCSDPPAPDIVDGVNAAFLSSFMEVRRHGTGVLCLYGEYDHEVRVRYDELFRSRFALPNGEPAERWSTAVIEDAPHDFYSEAARRNFWREVSSFLREEGIGSGDRSPFLSFSAERKRLAYSS